MARFRIEAAKLPNIDPARCAVLRSWGIDTAADVDAGKIADIPGFGKNLTDKLVIWRDTKEKAFVYRPPRGAAHRSAAGRPAYQANERAARADC